MVPDRRLYLWSEFDDIPERTGIYAWYYRHTMSTFDIDRLIEDLAGLTANEAARRVADFLRVNLFRVFVEEPYDAKVWGPLKPTYHGELINQEPISADLVARLVAEPSRLRSLKKVLEDAAPEFASPVYIGMAVNLNVRLRKHKSLIERYKAAGGRAIDEDPQTPAESADHSFAREVIRRGFSPNGLAVAVRVIDAPESVHVDAENILNRINYPLCGRN